MTNPAPTPVDDFETVLAAIANGLPLTSEVIRTEDRALQIKHHDFLLDQAVSSLMARATEHAISSPDFLAQFYAEAWSKPLARTEADPTDPDAVNAELQLRSLPTIDDLNQMRRDFALANHPDRLPKCYREQATRRMMIANMLIDAEIERRARGRK